MSSIVSATTKATYGAAAHGTRREQFFRSAHVLLAQARTDYEAGALDMAMENAYRAALRAAGAVNAGSPVIRKRKRLPASAWDKLALTSDRGKEWASTFSAFSAPRNRAITGIEPNPDANVVLRLIALVEEFLEESTPGSTKAPLVA
ncbi:SAV_6107 family HEPN domain-containing protein [Corynebacterium lipophiloflavum]|uniref:SAV-6107-like HEPN domain-containing protein n=1 Tax=Corynebacterium lipophiloflavum (strain ATCC 700352 / DSM 44291 / CCUG 37336 / JCM 10383 / DMMZ 1944) TaxID=525263 RepID=C0XRZ5_CORLD|nr:SAV_6107 family HEPN domain-containing protein [Corynebacterium lipophiloflavum]EEI16993.1 hypothetical protein HMPREF0298_1215 [Corynebacterium lipophiloflavum DSM 44291]